MPVEADSGAMNHISEAVRRRWRPEILERRLEREQKKRRNEIPVGFPRNLWQRNAFYRWINLVLKATGLYRVGNRSFLNPRLTANTVYLDRLPEAFNGYRILHLTDLHLDLAPELMDAVARKVARIDYDLVLVTGDYRDSLLPRGDVGVDLCVELFNRLREPVYGSLGNHDLATDIVKLEASNLQMLINESQMIERDGQRLYIVGVDDAGYHKAADFESAFRDVPQGACMVLMSHVPDVYKEASEHGVSLMLSGHTHGGQICLPGGKALMSHSRCPYRMVAGAWRYRSLQGYTSRGTGGCRVAARFFCPGEIVVHTLRRGNASATET